jgi:hypothetical protein
MRVPGEVDRSYLADDVDSPWAAGNKLSLSAMDLLEARQEALPALRLDRDCVLGVNVAQRRGCWDRHVVVKLLWATLGVSEAGERTKRRGQEPGQKTGQKAEEQAY